ncbi:Uncharacterised protein [Chlamydia trachomatis]|nr:Uncharacterised protein [Chlamydia trachomatis]CRH93349.1 Uncharacterised protein [Chlamydia trachomatis]
MQIKRILQVSTAFTTAVALFSGATLTETATEAPNTNDSLHAEQIVDAARDALGIKVSTDQIVPDRLDSVLSYDSAEGVTTLTVDGQ